LAAASTDVISANAGRSSGLAAQHRPINATRSSAAPSDGSGGRAPLTKTCVMICGRFWRS
jgi:hypothetical protein